MIEGERNMPELSLPVTDGGWQVIFADPPWRFSGNSAAKPGRNAMGHYPCMTIQQLCDMPVKDIVAKDALLMMWVTVPFLEKAFDVVKAWGFRYKSEVVWDKGKIGTGYWARNQHELLWICRRGKFPCLRPALFPTSVVSETRREHSRKPEHPQFIVQERYPQARKLELFARRYRGGWTTWGEHVGMFDGVVV